MESLATSSSSILASSSCPIQGGLHRHLTTSSPPLQGGSTWRLPNMAPHVVWPNYKPHLTHPKHKRQQMWHTWGVQKQTLLRWADNFSFLLFLFRKKIFHVFLQVRGQQCSRQGGHGGGSFSSHHPCLLRQTHEETPRNVRQTGRSGPASRHG